MKCININDPLVQEFIAYYGQAVTSAIVEEYNLNYTDKTLDPELARFIHSRLMQEDAKKFERPIVELNRLDINFLSERITPQSYQNIQQFLNSFNWPAITDISDKKLKISAPRFLQKQVEGLKKLTADETKAIAEGIVTYLVDTYNYLEKNKRDFQDFLGNPQIELKDKYVRGYQMLRLFDQFVEDIANWKSNIESTFGPVPANNILNETLNKIIALESEVKTLYADNAVKAVAEEFAKELAPQTRQLLEENKKEIEETNAAIRTTQDPKLKELLYKKKIQLEKQRMLFATPENLANALTKNFTGQMYHVVDGEKNVIASFDRQKDATDYIKNNRLPADYSVVAGRTQNIDGVSLFMESAALTSNLITGPVGSYIYNLHNDTQRDILEWENKMKNLSKRMLKKFPGRLVGEFSKEEFMRPYVREVIKMYIDKDGKKKYYKTYALNSEMDEHGYKLLLDEKRYEIEKETDPDKKAILEKQLKKFREDNEDRGYTEEYYRIQSLLSPEAREARQKILDEINMLSNYGADDFLDEATLDRISDLQFELARLGSLYNKNGIRKTPGSVEERIALNIQEWTKEKNASKIHLFEPSDERLQEFRSRLKFYQDGLKDARENLRRLEIAYAANEVEYASVQQARKNLQEKTKEFNDWKKINLKRTISPDFYELRKAITDQISTIQEKYKVAFASKYPNLRTDNEIWEDIFNLLKGYRDDDNIYKGTEIPTEIAEQIKELQLELNRNRELFKTLKYEISKRDQETFKQDDRRLQELYEQKAQLQKYENTQYYKDAVESRLSQIRSAEVYRLINKDQGAKMQYYKDYKEAVEKARIDYPDQNFAYHQMKATQVASALMYIRMSKQMKDLDSKVQKKFENSDWFKSNHIKMELWDDSVGQMTEQNVPIYFWSEVLPKNDVYIDYNSPSKRWNTFRVNPDFIRPDFKYIPGRTQLRKSSSFKNDNYQLLDNEQKALLQELTDLYLEKQRLTPQSVAKGLELPSVRKRQQTNIIDYANPVKRIKTWGKNTFDDIKGLDEEDDVYLAGSATMANAFKRRLMLRYVGRMDTSVQSIDALTSITMFGDDAIRFGKLFEKSPYLFGIRDLVNSSDISGSNAVKMINNLYDRQLFGRGSKTLFKAGTAATVERSLYKLNDEVVGLSSALFTTYKIPLAVKNFISNFYNAAVQSGTYDISIPDLLKGMGKGAPQLRELFLSSIKTGEQSEFVKKLRLFGIYDENVMAKARNLNPTDMEVIGLNINVLNMLKYVREFLDIETRIGVAYAIAEKYKFIDASGKDVNIFDAFQEVNGAFVPRRDLFRLDNNGNRIPATAEYIEEIKKVYIGRYHGVDALINGAQKSIDQGEIKRYALGRLLMMLKSWLTYQTIRRVGGRRINYGGGFEYEGTYQALGGFIFNFIVNFPTAVQNVRAWSQTQTKVRRRAAFSALMDTAAIATLYSIIYLVSEGMYGNDPEDPENKRSLWSLSYVTDELETLHPLAGPYAFFYSRFAERNIKENGIVYTLHKAFGAPYESIKDISKTMMMYARPEVEMFDDYVPRTASGKIDVRKNIPKNKALEGKPDIVAQFLQISGITQNINFVNSPEYLWSTFKHYYPKAYVSDIQEDIENIGSDINASKARIKDLRNILKYIENEERESTIRELISEEKDKLQEYYKKRRDLKEIMEENSID